MSQRYEILYPRNYVDAKGEKQVQWMVIGTAFGNKAGDGFDCLMHAVPPPSLTFKRAANGEEIVESTFRFMLKIPRPKEGGQQGGGGFRASAPAQPNFGPGEGDDVPF